MCQVKPFCLLQIWRMAVPGVDSLFCKLDWTHLEVDHHGGLQWLSLQISRLVRVQAPRCLPQELAPLRLRAPVQELPYLRLARELLHLLLILVRGWDCRAVGLRVPALQHPGPWLSP